MTRGLEIIGCRRNPLAFRFYSKWSYKSEEITAIFLAAVAEEEEEQEEAALCVARWIGPGFC